MSNQSLAVNFNVFNEDSPRQELQKVQTYINTLNSLIAANSASIASLSFQLQSLITKVQTVPKTYTYVTDVAAQTITIAEAINNLILDPSSLAATCTVIMPSSPTDGQNVEISTGAYGITALTLSPNTGQTFSSGSTISTLTANSSVKYLWVAGTTNKWFKIG